MLEKDVYTEMSRRRIWLIRLRVLDDALSSATFYYDASPWQTVTFEPPHRCNCDFCNRDEPAPRLDWLDGCDDDWFLAELDDFIVNTSDERWNPTPGPSLFDDTPFTPAPVTNGDYTITIYRDRERVSIEDGYAEPPGDKIGKPIDLPTDTRASIHLDTASRGP